MSTNVHSKTPLAGADLAKELTQVESLQMKPSVQLFSQSRPNTSERVSVERDKEIEGAQKLMTCIASP